MHVVLAENLAIFGCPADIPDERRPVVRPLLLQYTYQYLVHLVDHGAFSHARLFVLGQRYDLVHDEVFYARALPFRQDLPPRVNGII